MMLWHHFLLQNVFPCEISSFWHRQKDRGQALVGAIAATAIVIIFSPAVAFAAPSTVLFSDDFEAGNFAKWNSPISPQWEVNFGSITGIYGADVEGNAGPAADALTKSVSTAGYENIRIEYRFKADSLDDDGHADQVRVEYTTNGGATWNLIYAIKDGDDDHIADTDIGLHHNTHLLPADAANKSGFGIRFAPDLLGGPDEVWVDDVLLTGEAMGSGGTPPPPPPPTQTSEETTYTQCGDGVDNDGDGLIDVYDLGCLNFRQTVTVVTQVNGGVMVPAGFLMNVRFGSESSRSNIPGSASGVDVTNPFTGVWDIDIVPVAGYTTTFSGDCDAVGMFAMGFNIHKDCVITHTFGSVGAPPPPPPPPTPTPVGEESSYAQCDDGIDNDGDGLTDVFDLGCLIFRQTATVVTEVRGGPVGAPDFLINVRFADGTTRDNISGNASGVDITNPTTGIWDIDVVPRAGYVSTFGGDCDASGAFAVSFNTHKDCRVIHTFTP